VHWVLISNFELAECRQNGARSPRILLLHAAAKVPPQRKKSGDALNAVSAEAPLQTAV